MKVWKYLGWDTKEARTERVKDTNRHNTIQTIAICAVLCVGIASCAALTY